MWGVVSGFQESSCAFVEEEHSCGGPEIRWWNTVLNIPRALVAWGTIYMPWYSMWW